MIIPNIHMMSQNKERIKIEAKFKINNSIGTKGPKFRKIKEIINSSSHFSKRKRR